MTHMKIYAAKSFFMKNAGLYPETSKKGGSPTGTFLGQFSKHWFVSIYICLGLINNMKILLKGGHSTWKTWKYLEIPGIYLHLEKRLENSIFGEIHVEIPGKIFSCCKKNLAANHKINFFKQCT